MSILDQTDLKVIDDVEELTCSLIGAETIQSYTVFIMRVQRGVKKENCWKVKRRYSDFVALHESLKVSGLELSLPPKKLLGNMEREFIASRQAGLQQLMNEILENPILASCVTVKKFLDEENYKVNQTENSLQFVSMFLRSETNWELIETCKEFGRRIRKCFFLVKRREDNKQRYLLTWTQFGPNRLLPMKDLISAMKLLTNTQHPSIESVTYASASENGVLVIRRFNREGSIRDLICKTKPSKISYLKRYNPQKSRIFTLAEIRQYGRQILEAVAFLHSKGLAFHHLHAGNVVIEKEICKLVDIESYFVGISPHYKVFYSHFRKIHSSESIDVYSFGQLLYEMVFGKPLNQPTIDQLPSTSPALIRSVLESILSVEACKNGLPTLEALLSHTLFHDETVVTVGIKPQLKIPGKMKEAFRAYKESQERKLKEEQKQISQAKRMTKAKAYHLSDSERRKRKLEARKKSTRKSTECDVKDDAIKTEEVKTVTEEAEKEKAATSLNAMKL